MASLFFSLSRGLCFTVASLAMLVGLCPASTPTGQSAAGVWVEAEDAEETNFRPAVSVNVAADGTGASGSMVLALNVETRPGNDPSVYYSEHTFSVGEAGDYAFWLSTTPQPVGWVSPLYVKIDDGDFTLVGGPQSGTQYGGSGNKFYAWIKVGVFRLESGTHRLRFEVRDLRAMDRRFVAFIDAFFFTKDQDYRPRGNRPRYSPQPPFAEVLKGRSLEEYVKSLELPLYFKGMARTQEQIGAASAAEVLAKIRRRPLPDGVLRDPGPNEFGVHGMEKPFVRAGVDREKVEQAYELLARVGVQSFRTAESCWHRLGADFDHFKELDYQVDNAMRYGMSHLFTVGYPPARYNVFDHHLSAVAPAHLDKYRAYLSAVIDRYKDRGLRYVELGNEVDAVETWWRGATAEMYVNEMRVLREVVDERAPGLQVVAFGATRSRRADRGGPHDGRRFISKCFDLGIDQYVDAYALHYTWPLAEKEFPEFFRDEMKRLGLKEKPLLNTEEAGYGKPSDVIRVFARDFFLYGMPRVDWYLAQDWFEAGKLISSGLFDREWNPKLRLLAYALSVDAMKDRTLVGIAAPSEGVEAYVLKKVEARRDAAPAYSIVMWKNDPAIRESMGGSNSAYEAEPVLVSGLKGVSSAFRWNLDELPGDSGSFPVTDHPVVVFCDTLPDWKLASPAEWLAANERKADSEALLPMP